MEEADRGEGGSRSILPSPKTPSIESSLELPRTPSPQGSVISKDGSNEDNTRSGGSTQAANIATAPPSERTPSTGQISPSSMESWMRSSPDALEHGDDDSSSSSDETELSPRANLFSNPPQPDIGKRNTKAYLNVRSENMRGRGASNVISGQKWHKIAEDMRHQKIGVMALQETHLAAHHIEDIERVYSHLKVFNTADPTNPTGAGGVAIVLNSLITNTRDAETTVLVEGRAILLKLNWHRDQRIGILAVYAPTVPAENRSFWKEIKKGIKKLKGPNKRPEILLGDFNFVEDPLDRFPVKKTRIDSPESFDELKKYLRVTDGWRQTNPDATEWTWRNSDRSTMSRIDRIYVTEELLLASRAWEIQISNLTTNDHSRVGVELVNLDAPETGPGRWAMRPEIVKDRQFIDAVTKVGIEALESALAILPAERSDERNPQRVWKRFKDDIARLARERGHAIAQKFKDDEEKLAKARERASQSLKSALTDEEVSDARKALRKAENGIFEHKDKVLQKTFFNREVRAQIEAETMSKAWFNWPKEKKTRNVMFSFRKPGSEPAEFITASKHMADAAGEYHDGVQAVDIAEGNEERQQEIDDALADVQISLTGREAEDLGATLSHGDVTESITLSKNGSAPGTDGIIYELWKELASRHRDAAGTKKKTLDIAGFMLVVFKDVQENGPDENACFTEGWMCPLYKKGDRSDIANYRPITLLNTDYKIFTKILALRLAKVAPRLIHKSQVGFVRGRSITDLTKLVCLMTDFAEVSETDGMMVALDQEKAYDRVRHDYLLATLERMNFPNNFVGTVRALYEQAQTSVMINGFLGKRYKVTRGVRQGDPLSCLLFNIAIEPLSISLQCSALQGISVPGLRERLISTMYADDTTVYLSADDDFAALQAILDRWCKGSGARFNVKKSEVVPLGRPDFRERLWSTRKPNDQASCIPDNVKIAKDGEAIRILGAWPGNSVDQTEIWSTRLEKLQLTLERWKRSSPTVFGLGIISRVIIGGHTQYLAAAQGMPDEITLKVERITADFFWGADKKHTVNIETLRRPKNEGGVALFDVATRNEAQYLVWLRKYLCDEDRPIWAFLADAQFKNAMTKADARRIPLEQRTNPFEQNWKPNIFKLPAILKCMWEAATKHGLCVDEFRIPEQAKLSASAWSHPALDRTALDGISRRIKFCLKNRHAVRTVEDLDEIAIDDEPDHEDEDWCDCDNCEADRGEGCRAPWVCQQAARDVLNDIPEKWSLNWSGETLDQGLERDLGDRTMKELTAGETCAVPRFFVEDEPWARLYRILVNRLGIDPLNAKDTMARCPVKEPESLRVPSTITVCISSAMADDNGEEAQGGVCLFFPDGERDAVFHTLAEGRPNFDSAALLGFRIAAEIVDSEDTLHIISTSKLACASMTVRLAHYESSGWISAPDIAKAGREASAALRRRRGETSVTYVSKDRLAAWPEVKEAHYRAAGMSVGDANDLGMDNTTLADGDKPGLSLHAITQGVAHKAICWARCLQLPSRRPTDRNIALIKEAILRITISAPTTKQIWKDLQSRALSRQARQFLWKAIHEVHKTGPYFRNMKHPWSEYVNCPVCDSPESIEHILLRCPQSGCETIWALVDDLLQTRRISVEVDLGIILGCASVRITSPDAPRNKADERLFSIVVSESAFLIWKIRCEARLEHEGDAEWRLSDEAVKKRWQSVIRKRKLQDIARTNVARYGKKAMYADVAYSTWRDQSRDTFLTRFGYVPGVLVGTGTPNRADGVG